MIYPSARRYPSCVLVLFVGGGVAVQQGWSHPGVRGRALFSAALMAAANSGIRLSVSGRSAGLGGIDTSLMSCGVLGRLLSLVFLWASSSSESSDEEDEDDDELLDDDDDDESVTTSGTAGNGSGCSSSVKSTKSMAGGEADGRRGPTMATGTTSLPTTTSRCMFFTAVSPIILGRPASSATGGRAAGVTIRGRGWRRFIAASRAASASLMASMVASITSSKVSATITTTKGASSTNRLFILKFVNKIAVRIVLARNFLFPLN